MVLYTAKDVVVMAVGVPVLVALVGISSEQRRTERVEEVIIEARKVGAPRAPVDC